MGWSPASGWHAAHIANTGRPLTPEHKAAISRGLKGKKKTAEHRAALSRTWERSTRFARCDQHRLILRAAQAVDHIKPSPGRARPRRGRRRAP